MLIDKKKRTCHLVDFVVPMEHRVKIKERPDLVLINKKRSLEKSSSGFCRSIQL